MGAGGHRSGSPTPSPVVRQAHVPTLWLTAPVIQADRLTHQAGESVRGAEGLQRHRRPGRGGDLDARDLGVRRQALSTWGRWMQSKGPAVSQKNPQ